MWSDLEYINRKKTPGCSSKCPVEKLAYYEITFQVLSRKGGQVFNKVFKWDNLIVSKKDGYVNPHNRVIQMGNISLDYATVNYWVQNIKWKKSFIEKPREDKGPKAFTIKEQLEAIKAREESEGQKQD